MTEAHRDQHTRDLLADLLHCEANHERQLDRSASPDCKALDWGKENGRGYTPPAVNFPVVL